MVTYKNDSAETFEFPTISVVAEPGDSFDTDAVITASGVIVSPAGKKKAAPVVEAPVEVPAPVDAPADPAPADVAVATETPAPVEEVK